MQNSRQKFLFTHFLQQLLAGTGTLSRQIGRVDAQITQPYLFSFCSGCWQAPAP